MGVSNIIDKPRTAGTDDLLGIEKYENALIKFIETCQMPTTLAIQGEWGSGKTSLLNQIRHRLCEVENETVEYNKQKAYYGIWVNTWQYSLMKSKDEALISIIKGLTAEIMRVINRKHKSKAQAAIAKVGNLFGKIATAGAKVAISTIGVDGDSVVENLLGTNEEGTESLMNFKSSLQDAINQCLKEDNAVGNNNKGFIFFIDDLDRIDPPVAVEILELIKNIFEVDNCIFVLAIDYEVVVKGLVPKFGPLTEKNEREFRSFFDKIIQLPFSMPVNAYDVEEFLINSLEEVGYIGNQFKDDDSFKKSITDLAMLSVGTNPRSLKRLINTLSLLNIILELENPDDNSKESYELLINFGLVCAQIAYPKLYSFLIQEPDFKNWSENTAKKYRLPEINESQIAILEGSTEFDEEWEKVLFRKCMQDPYLSAKAFHISQFFNLIAQLLPPKMDLGCEIQRILSFSAVTNVNLDMGSQKATAAKFAKVRFDSWDDFEREFRINYPDKNYISILKHIHDYMIMEYKDLMYVKYGPSTLTFNVKNLKQKGGRVFMYNTFHKKYIISDIRDTAKVNISDDLTFNQEIKDQLKNVFNSLSSIEI